MELSLSTYFREYANLSPCLPRLLILMATARESKVLACCPCSFLSLGYRIFHPGSRNGWKN
ncbi:MAG: hypothetical protein R2941_02435 [Desulfobacterales bacterium]